MVKRKFKIIISKKATNSIKNIHDYISLDSPKNSTMVVTEIYRLIKSISIFPYKHSIDYLQSDDNINYRYVAIWSFKIHYKIEDELIIINFVSHASQSPENIIKKLQN